MSNTHTWANLRAKLRQIVIYTDSFPDAALNTIMGQAILDYSTYFPIVSAASITTEAETTSYDLQDLAATAVRTVLRCEYPADQSPARFLIRRDRTDPRGFAGLPVYAIEGSPLPSTIVIGEEPAAAETIRLLIESNHAIPTSDAQVLTVPDNHIDALLLYCQWQVVSQLHATHSIDPQTTTLLVSMFGSNWGRMERIYRTKIRELLENEPARLISIQWDNDRWDEPAPSRWSPRGWA